MNRLEQLIQELCPNGIEYKTLGEIATITRGGNFQKKDYCEVGIPCIHYGQIYTQYGLFTDKALSHISPEIAKKQKMAMPTDIIMAVTSENIEDVCKCCLLYTSYCNHCQPCPAGLDVGLINKYYDLARAGDALARDHYANLGTTAAACIGCGHCDARCPFQVKQVRRMEEIAAYFGG